MKRLYLIAIFQFTMILAVLISCKSDDESIFEIITISKFSARDIGDANNANDILVEFTIENTDTAVRDAAATIKNCFCQLFNQPGRIFSQSNKNQVL